MQVLKSNKLEKVLITKIETLNYQYKGEILTLIELKDTNQM